MGYSKQLDLATFIGITVAIGLLVYAIQLGGSLKSFYDVPSLLIVLGGTFGATLINHPLGDFARTMALLRTAFLPDRARLSDRVSRLLHYCRRLRAESLQSVKADFEEESDSFLRQSLELLGDGVQAAEIRKIMEIELGFLDDRHRRGARLFQTLGQTAPAMGLVGTLIGLVQMLQHLEDPSQIGPGMSLALLTTFYGAIIANVLFIPLAGKLRTRSEEELLLKELTIEGVVGLGEGLNPLALERRLLRFLPTDKRVSEYD